MKLFERELRREEGVMGNVRIQSVQQPDGRRGPGLALIEVGSFSMRFKRIDGPCLHAGYHEGDQEDRDNLLQHSISVPARRMLVTPSRELFPQAAST